MALADDLANRPRRTTRPCLTGQWLATQTVRDRDAFTAYLADGGTMSDLHMACVRNGLDAGLTTFKQHCRGRCSCTRTLEAAA